MLQPRGFVADDREIARASGVVEPELGHRERFKVAAHRRHRCRQLVRDVGQQLPPRAIRRGQRVGARRQIVGHRVERRRHRRHFVAAANGRAGRQITGAQAARRVFDRAQAPARRPENQQRRDERARRKSRRGDDPQRRRISPQQEPERRAREDDDHAGQLAADHDRLRRGRRRRTVHPARSEAPAASAGSTSEPIAIGREAALQPPARRAEQRFGIRRREVAEHASIGEHDEERVGIARVLVVDVVGEIDRRIGGQRLGELGGDGLREAFGLARQRRTRARHDPDEQHRLDDQHRGERQDEADRDAPVEAAVPTLGARG